MILLRFRYSPGWEEVIRRACGCLGSLDDDLKLSAGIRIPNTQEVIVEPENGYSVYLTIDKDIQLVLENAISKVNEQYIVWIGWKGTSGKV